MRSIPLTAQRLAAKLEAAIKREQERHNRRIAQIKNTIETIEKDGSIRQRPYERLFSEITKHRPRALGELMERIVQRLSRRESSVLKLRYGLGTGRMHTLEEIGKAQHVTRERIRQILEKGLRKCRHPEYLRLLAPFEKASDSIDLGPSLCAKCAQPVAVDLPIKNLNFTTRAYNTLRNAGILTVSDLTMVCPRQLLRMKNFGRVSLESIIENLATIALGLQKCQGPQCPHGRTR